MSLTAADVAEIMRLVEQSTFDELTLEVNGVKLTLRRGAGSGAVTTSQASKAPEALPAAAPAAAPKTARRADPDERDVVAPMLGTFYRAPKPGAPPFVEVGATVEEETVVGIIEVMKLMNTVRAGVRGTVSEIVAADGSLVEYGETILRVRKKG